MTYETWILGTTLRFSWPFAGAACQAIFDYCTVVPAASCFRGTVWVVCLTFMKFILGPFLPEAAQQHDPWYEMEWTYFLMTKHLPNPEAKIQPLTYWTKHPQIILWFGLGLTWMLPCHVQADEKHLQWQKESRDNESCLLVVEYDLQCEDLSFPGCSCAPPAIQQIVLIILQGMHGLTFLPVCNRDVVLYRHYVSIIFYR